MSKKIDANDVARSRGPDGLANELDRRTVEAQEIRPVGPASRLAVYEPFPIEALAEPARTYVSESAKAIGCDPSFVALPLLSALASGIGNTRRVVLKPGWWEPAVVWSANVGDSGTLKSPAQDSALRPLRERQAAAMKVHEEAVEAHETARLRYEATLSTWKRDGAEKGADPPRKPEEPVPRRLICSDTTVEALAAVLQYSPRGILLARDELAGWLDSFDAYRRGRGGDVAHWLEMHRAGSLLIDRKTGDRKTLHIRRAAVSIVGTIQTETLRRVLGRVHFEDGLAARLLLAMPPRRPRRWTEAVLSSHAEAQVGKLFDGLLTLDFGQDAIGEAAPINVSLSPHAKELWVNFYNEHAQQQAQLADPDLVAAWSKLEGYAARLALVVHMVRVVASGADPSQIGEQSMRDGITLSRWFAREACRVYAVLRESPEEGEQRRLVEFVRAKGGQVTVRDLMRGGPCYPTADEAKAALDDLQEVRWGEWASTQPTSKGGRPTDVFVLRDGTDTDRTARIRPP